MDLRNYDILTTKELAEYLRCSISTVYLLTELKEIPFFKIGTRYKYVKKDVLKALTERIEK